MNFSLIVFGIYLALLIWVLYSAGRRRKSKSAAIGGNFKLGAEEIQIKKEHPLFNRIWKLTSTGWSLAFMMLGILLIPTAGSQDGVWVQFLIVLGVELGFLMVGLVVIREFEIMNWYLECYICKFQFYKIAFFFSMCAIVFGNAALVIPFIPWGGIAQVSAAGFMIVALYFLVSPIREEAKYYA